NFRSYVCAPNSAACPCPCPAEPTSGSVMTVPPKPSLARWKLPVEYWPRRVRLAVCVPFVTVNVPLRWFCASVKDTFVLLLKVMARRSIFLGQAEGEGKPGTKAWKWREATSRRNPPGVVEVAASPPVHPPEATSSVPPFIVVALAIPPDNTVSKPPEL